MKFKQLQWTILLCGALVLALTSPNADAASRTDWFKNARYGVFMHFLPGDAKTLAQVDDFDVEAVVDQLDSMGAGYLVLTLGQNSGYFNAPNPVYDKWTGYQAGERCAKRDLPMELARALKAKGIRLMLYLPCQTPNRDTRAQAAFGIAQGPKDQPIDVTFAKKWAEVIGYWSQHYGDQVAGWWFDGGYAHVGFNESIAQIYREAVLKGNPEAIVSFNPGVRLIRHTQAEDYTAGELNEPFGSVPSSRWVEGSQWHALTFLGSRWGERNIRFPTEQWVKWVQSVTAGEGVVTLDMGPNWHPNMGPIGTFSGEQISQVRAIRSALSGATDASDIAGAGSWVDLFDGQTLTGWRASESQNTFSVVDGAIQAHGDRSHLFYTGGDGKRADWKNFELVAEVKARSGANSGIYFHTAFQETNWPSTGFEVQVNNSQKQHGDYLEMKKTGSLYGIRNIYKPMAGDDEWFEMAIQVMANRVQIRVHGLLLVDYIQPPDASKKLSRGTFALQGHDPESQVCFRNLRVRTLPDNLADAPVPGPVDAVYHAIERLGKANYPMVDLHTHLKGGLTNEELMEHMRQTGINHGIAVNGGVGFPITDDAGIEAFRQSMEGTPFYIALQAEGREWPTLFSPEAIAKFDYVFTDAMTITDHRGRRTRLWMPEEVEIPNKQEFMENLVRHIESIMTNEPIDIYVNSTFLPAAIADEYDALWTTERMDRVIKAAVDNGIAIEINSRYRIPSATFIQRAKKAGVKFTLGTNNVTPELGRLEYCIEMIDECGLTWQDLWMPKPDGQKPIQAKTKFRR